MQKQWTVLELWVYPIKSCRGTSLQAARIGVHGLAQDRRYMVVEKKTGMFVAQRSDGGLGIPIRTMCQIVPTLLPADNMILSAPGMPEIRVVPGLWNERLRNIRREVQVWKVTCEGVIANREVNDWFTEFLSRERPGNYQLVTMSEGFIRRAKIGFSQLRFADAYPFLVISQESLDDLNQRIGGEPLPMNRFRPNIVIKGGIPYDEDRIDRMVIAEGVELEGQTVCERCPVPATDQITAILGKEPNRTLAKYRRGRHLDSAHTPNANGGLFWSELQPLVYRFHPRGRYSPIDCPQRLVRDSKRIPFLLQ